MSDIKWVAWMRRNHMAVLKGPDYDFLSGLEYLPDGQRHDNKFHERTPWLDKPQPPKAKYTKWSDIKAREAKERTEMSDDVIEHRDRHKALAIERRDHTALKQEVRDNLERTWNSGTSESALIATAAQQMEIVDQIRAEVEFMGSDDNLVAFIKHITQQVEPTEDYMEPRDHFAAAALNGHIAGKYAVFGPNPLDHAPDDEDLAKYCYQMADAMMAERAKRGDE